MSYRYSTTDIIVGVGMCAIVFGALLFFIAANGMLQPASLQMLPSEGSTEVPAGMVWLQPAIGQALLDQAALERRTNRDIAEATAEWSRASLAHHTLHALPGGPLGMVVRDADTIPAEHAARVQLVMGRAVVNFTQRGIRSGVLSANLYVSDYNSDMIRRTEAGGQRLSHDFTSAWQGNLGHRIVSATQDYLRWDRTNQEQLGRAILHVTHVQAASEEAQMASQSQLASLVVAAIRTNALVDRLTLLAAIESISDEPTAPAVTASWPEIPMGFLLAAALMLAVVFFGGLSLSGRNRETKSLAEMRYDSARWVYRMAA